MEKTNKLVLEVDTGAVEVEVRDKGETIGTFKFNPNDMDIVKRYEHVMEALQKLEIPEDGGEEVIFAVSDEIKKQIDYLLNYKVSDSIFSKCNPLTLTTAGDFYCEDVLEKIANIIERVTEQRIKKKKTKIKRATEKYSKG